MKKQYSYNTQRAEHSKKRKALLALLSKKIKGVKADVQTVNECLGALYGDFLNLANGGKGIEFETFLGWKKRGFQVKKGACGLPLWTKPVTKKGKESEAENEKDEYTFFGTACVFAGDDVINKDGFDGNGNLTQGGNLIVSKASLNGFKLVSENFELINLLDFCINERPQNTQGEESAGEKPLPEALPKCDYISKKTSSIDILDNLLASF